MNYERKLATRRLATRGFSLVELMVALVLGLLVLGGVIQLFLGSKVTFMTNDAMARVQENGRFALEMIKPDARSVSTRGMCAGRANVTNHLDIDGCDETVSTLFDTSYGIIGWEYDGTGRGATFDVPTDLDPSGIDAGNWTSVGTDGSDLDLPAALRGEVVPGTDVLVTRNLKRLDLEISGVQNNTQLDVVGSETIPSGSIILVTNCESGSDLMQQAKRQNDVADPTKPVMDCNDYGPGNESPGQSSWGTQHDDTSAIYSIVTVAYYIGFNAARGEPGLYRANISEARDASDIVHEELVEGVESLQLAYWATDSGQSATGLYTADEVDDWSVIVGAKVGLLVRSPENGDMQAVSQDFDLAFGTATGPEDRRLRHAFSSTIAVRNQQIVL